MYVCIGGRTFTFKAAWIRTAIVLAVPSNHLTQSKWLYCTVVCVVQHTYTHTHNSLQGCAVEAVMLVSIWRVSVGDGWCRLWSSRWIIALSVLWSLRPQGAVDSWYSDPVLDTVSDYVLIQCFRNFRKQEVCLIFIPARHNPFFASCCTPLGDHTALSHMMVDVTALTLLQRQGMGSIV